MSEEIKYNNVLMDSYLGLFDSVKEVSIDDMSKIVTITIKKDYKDVIHLIEEVLVDSDISGDNIIHLHLEGAL